MVRKILRMIAVAYPASLLAVALMLRYIGEGWWVTTFLLYLPRVAFAAPLPFIVVGLLFARMRSLLWLQTVSSILVVFHLMGFVLPWPVSADADAVRVRVLSFNVHSGVGGVEPIVAEIDRHAPDVVLLQEVGNGESFAALLRPHYATVEVSGQFLLATRFPLVSSVEPPKIFYAGDQRSPRFIEYVLDTALGPVAFYSVHPISPREALFSLRGEHGLKREIVSGGIFDGAAAPLIKKNAGLRTLQIETAWESAARETMPVVIAGDTNLPGLSRTLHRTLANFQDGFRSASWGFGYTFPTNKWRPWMRIDRVFASERLRFVDFQVGNSRVSDHRCVVADLQAAPRR
jgi:endonuclease/exonuclease/phosphatase (EEP) superfamily protein YafD